MNFWSVFVTGLLAGGASCAVVQGGLLTGAVARRHGTNRGSGRRTPAESSAGSSGWRTVDDVRPIGAFLLGKLASHALLGALLGGLGGAAQLGFRTRAFMQIGAGVVMVAMAAHLLGARGLRRLVPSPPARLTRLVRRSARAESVFAPALLGFATVLIPCGITLSVMVLVVASGSALTGAIGMAVFVLGTSPLFAVLGYFLRRSAGWFRGYLGKAAAVAVAVAGLVSINSGLALAGSSVTLGTAWSQLTGSGSQARADIADGSDSVSVDPSGVQRIVVRVGDGSCFPSFVRARAGLPTQLVLRTQGTRGCTRGFVIPSTSFETELPVTGDTIVDLGRPTPRRISYTCSMGMYRGVIEIS